MTDYLTQVERQLEVTDLEVTELRKALEERDRQLTAAVKKLDTWERLLRAQDKELKGWRNGSKSLAMARLEEHLTDGRPSQPR